MSPMKPFVPESIEKVELYPPGMPIDEIRRVYGISGEIVKLNSNENCLGPSPMAVKAAAASLREIHLYPDNSAYDLKAKLAKKYNVGSEQIIMGNGSNELIQFVAMTFLLPGQEVITAAPTFLLYSIMGRALGGRVKEVPLSNFVYDLESMAAEITEETKLVFISNPNNPTGTIVTRKAFDRFMQAVPADLIVVVDEAYAEYVTSSEYPDALSYVAPGRNVMILRTFSKAYGLAGLRIGFAIAPARLVNYMERVREPHNVNTLAQRAALAALDDREHLRRTQENNRIGREYLSDQLARLGISFVPTQANFILVHIGPRASAVHQSLLQAGVMVRAISGHGLDHYLRVTIGLPAENHTFITALEQAMRGNGGR